MKAVKLYRTHQEDLSEISQLSAQTLYTHYLFTATKIKADTKLDKIKNLLSSLFLPFSKDKIRIKI